MEVLYSIPWWALLPFVCMLLMIAVGPLVAEKWWESNTNKLIVSFVLGVPTAIFLINHGLGANIEHQMLYDYLPFIILLTSLYVITGGIHLSGDIKASPAVNTLFMGIGFVLASLMGTTGAAMLLIRPLIETNRQRQYKAHTIMFFIATVANCGGLMTPLGDPPLFLLYLRGAGFTWFLSMFPQWITTGLLLMGIYFLYDTYVYRRKEEVMALIKDSTDVSPLCLSGKINIMYLLFVVLSVAFINESFIPAMGEEDAPMWIKFLREIVLLGLIFLSYYTTRQSVRQSNHYSWKPILEVAVVFVGIFMTMIPALLFLKEHAASFGLHQPWHFYYATGALSSFLDNAPTALAFHGVASGLVASGQAVAEVAGVPEHLLQAISMGAVFFGALTYIGNGPNFMVKSIAEENGIKMPSFFAYMAKFSLIVLLPIYILVQAVFL